MTVLASIEEFSRICEMQARKSPIYSDYMGENTRSVSRKPIVRIDSVSVQEGTTLILQLSVIPVQDVEELLDCPIRSIGDGDEYFAKRMAEYEKRLSAARDFYNLIGIRLPERPAASKSEEKK